VRSTHRVALSAAHCNALLPDAVDEYNHAVEVCNILQLARPHVVVQGGAGESGDTFLALTGTYLNPGTQQREACLIVMEWQAKLTNADPGSKPMNPKTVQDERDKAYQWITSQLFHDFLKSAGTGLEKLPRFCVFGLVTNRKSTQAYVAVEDTFLVCEQNLRDRYPVGFSAPLLSQYYLSDSPGEALNRLHSGINMTGNCSFHFLKKQKKKKNKKKKKIHICKHLI